MKRTLGILTTSLLLLLTACGQPLAGNGTSEFTLLLTDAPASEASWIRVDFGRIDLVPSEDSEDGIIVLSEDGGTIDNILDLQNGDVTTLVSDLLIPDGTYEQIRLIVEGVTIAFGEEGSEEVHSVTVPSGAQTGLKINVEPALHAQAGQTSQIILDFDASTAIVEAPPGSNNYLLKPTGIRAVTESGVLEGTVLGSEGGLEGATVNVYEGTYDPAATPLVGTITESGGNFRFITLTAGTYAVEIMMPGYESAIISDVALTAGETTGLGEITLVPVTAAP